MSEEIKNTNTEQQPTTPTPEGNGGQGNGKMFTQEEVNRIVSDRLAREREKQTQQPEDEREKALREREEALKIRESKAACQDYMRELSISDKYKSVLLEVLDTSDADKFKTAVDKITDTFGMRGIVKTVGATVARPPLASKSVDIDSKLDAIFKPKI